MIGGGKTEVCLDAFETMCDVAHSVVVDERLTTALASVAYYVYVGKLK